MGVISLEDDVIDDAEDETYNVHRSSQVFSFYKFIGTEKEWKTLVLSIIPNDERLCKVEDIYGR